MDVTLCDELVSTLQSKRIENKSPRMSHWSNLLNLYQFPEKTHFCRFTISYLYKTKKESEQF